MPKLFYFVVIIERILSIKWVNMDFIVNNKISITRSAKMH